jgi:hypothetical protein
MGLRGVADLMAGGGRGGGGRRGGGPLHLQQARVLHLGVSVRVKTVQLLALVVVQLAREVGRRMRKEGRRRRGRGRDRRLARGSGEELAAAGSGWGELA